MLKSSKGISFIFLCLFGLIIADNLLYRYSYNDLNNNNEGILNENSNTENELRISTIQLKNETINSDETWSGNILVTRSIVVSKGVTLTILPGTVIKFKNYRGYKEPEARLSIFIAGTIKAQGTPDQQIWFTSDAEPPINGDWDGIYMNGTTNSIFNYTIVEYGLVGIVQFHSESIVANSIVRWVNTEGLYAEYSNVEYVNNTLYGNGYHEIALEQFNNANVTRNIFKNGTVAFHSENSEVYLKRNYIANYSGDIVSIAAHTNATLEENIFDPSLPYPRVTVTPNSNVTLINNDNGTVITLPIPVFDYQDTKNYTLGYKPGDQEDLYPYVYDQLDETRRVVKRIGEGLSFGWALEYAMGYLWRFDFWNISLGLAENFIRMDPDTGAYIEIQNNVIENGRGLAWDGEYFFGYDHSQLKIFKFNLSGNAINIIDSFDLPKKEEGGIQGLTSDGEFLYIPSRGGALVRKINKTGAIIEEIDIPGEGISGGLVWTGSHFWGVTGGGNLTKYTHDWQRVGQIYPVADGTWAIAWDGDYIWSLQRTCESWDDAKMFQIEPLISTKTNYLIIKEDTPYNITIKSNSSDYGLRFNNTRNDISFEIYGRTGTRGYCDILIPKAILIRPHGASIDGIPLPFVLFESDNEYLIHIEYQHSYHEIRIYFEHDSTTPIIPWLYILPISLVFIVLLSIRIYHLRKKDS
ncbi:MAG: right-handed parallel beta-helix repeat-containing protein [Candidatus Heimdallarchaeota archaeon]